MIKEFTIRNYLSFKNETIFTMEADMERVSEHQDHLVKFGDDHILKIASFYGPNGSGKSNFLKAFLFFKDIIKYGVENFNEDELKRRLPRRLKEFEKFNFCHDDDNTIDFKIFFINKKYEIGYELKIEKVDNSVIINYENMSYRQIKSKDFIFVFERNKTKLELSEELKLNLPSVDFNFSDKVTIVNFINKFFVNDKNKNDGVFDVINNFMFEISTMLVINSSSIIPFLEKDVKYKWLQEERIRTKTIEIINDLGIKINNILIDKDEDTIYLIREIDGKKYKLDIDKESEGTKTLLFLLPNLILNIIAGGVFIVDEIDAHLHPKLIKAVIEIFTSKHNNKAQLIFSSHDILNMTNDLFRRDEIWFVVKDEKFSSELFALTDFVNYKGERVRKDAKYSKQYLEGKYGADPFIQKGVFWDGKNS